MKRHGKKWTAVAVALAMLLGTVLPVAEPVQAKKVSEKKSTVKMQVQAEGVYQNWDGVSNVAQFVNADGEFCFAYDNGKTVEVVRTKKGTPQKKTISLKKKYPIFGGVVCDTDGNYYMVTGRINSTTDTDKKTIFVSKYDKNGKLLKTVGDNGSSSLAYYYDSSFYTRTPFDGGNCEIAINGDILAVNYAREMYSGHQSNSVFAVNIDTMKTVNMGTVYNSHSFAQRIIPYGEGFVSASEGDCYDRAFTITVSNPATQTSTSSNSFHFWVPRNALSNWDMYALNNNFAHMGGIAAVNDEQVALVGTSVKSLNKKAAEQNEQLFIQIFDPAKDLSSASAYVTSGERKGVSGPDGDEKVTDYGVKWLTKYNKNTTISNPQVVSDGNGKIVILYEKYVKYSYKGVCYLILNSDGKVLKKATLYSDKAQLNPCRMPVYSNGKVYWAANKYGDSTNTVYVYSLKID